MTSDYKTTLNLPQTTFPMKANLSQNELKTLKFWQQHNLYHKLRELRQGQPTFILHDGPPYANGDLHLGHAVNKILKDIIIKSQSMENKNAPYIPGWDCHGLPIEHQVEKKIGRAGSKVDFVTFRQKCREYAEKQVAKQKQDFIRMGVLGDWDNPYLTMNYATEANIIRALGKIAENGYLQRGYKPVYWSVVGRSALAEAEVEYHDKTSYSIDVTYPLLKASQTTLEQTIGQSFESTIRVQIWTTTPWTLPASLAISVHPELDYVVADIDNKLVVVAKELLEKTCERMNGQQATVLATFKGNLLQGLKTQHPFYNDRTIPLLLGEHVTLDAGTGCVHTAPDHGVDDFYICQRNGINTINSLDDGGVYRSHIKNFAGDHVYKVDTKVIELLQQCDQLQSNSQFEHSYPHCWRTKTPLIFRATPQWFIGMDDRFIEKLQQQVEQVQWIPHWGKQRIKSMIENSPDWCVSRQRTWGVPITLFIHKETGELHPDTAELFKTISAKVEEQGMDAWFESSVDNWLSPETAADYDKVTDTLDVWFDSGVTHFSVLDNNENLHSPADLYLEGSDQHRGWFQSSLKTSVAIKGVAPYKTVLTHGFTVDAEGRKMSKSLNNVMGAQEIINKYGADVLRLWIASTDYSAEMSYSQQAFERTSDSYRRIRNTMRYCLANLKGFSFEQKCNVDDMLELDKWLLVQINQLQQDIRASYQQYNFVQTYQRILHFCIVELGGFYLDVIKDRIYTCPTDSLARLSAQTAIYYVAQTLVRALAPILSFTAEEIWASLHQDDSDLNSNINSKAESSVFLTHYNQLPAVSNQRLSASDWQHIIEVKQQLNGRLEELRKEKVIGSSLQAEVAIKCPPEIAQSLQLLGDELRFVLICSSAIIIDDNADDLEFIIEVSTSLKCERCWHYCDDVGTHSQHLSICSRCIENIEQGGEKRYYV